MFTPIRFTLPNAPEQAQQPTPSRVVEAAGMQLDGEDEAGWSRLSANGGTAGNSRDLTPMSQEHMQRAAEFLWSSNLLANRLVELPLAYLLAEGVQLQCEDATHQTLLNKFWHDPINNWPAKLTPRVRDLSLMGEQCYRSFVNEADGHVRLGYVDPRLISEVVLDPDNPEQPIGVITRRDSRGRYKKYRVLVLGPEEVFSQRTRTIREGFADGEVFLFQVNKLATASRGRSDLLAQIDWLDAYDGFLFGELDRTDYLRSFVWDLKLTGAQPDDIAKRAAQLKPPKPNSFHVHNENEELTPKNPELNSADTSGAARLFRNHVLAGSTIPEHWIGGGGDVNRAAASEMGEPTFKMFTARQTALKLMLEELGRFVLASQKDQQPDWASPKWKVTALFPELVSKDVGKFAAAMQGVTAAVISLVDKGLLTEERALMLVADVAQRFGQAIDAKEEILKARAERLKRQADAAAADAFTTPGLDDDGTGDGSDPALQAAAATAAQASQRAQAAA